MSSVSPVSPSVILYLLRHGERADEVENSPEAAKILQRRWFDTPLTENGRAQARKAGRFMKHLLKGPPSSLFVSPLQRAIETALEFAQGLQDDGEEAREKENPQNPQFILVPGLASCAAAFQSGNIPLTRQTFLSTSELLDLPSVRQHGEELAKKAEWRHEHVRKFDETIQKLCDEALAAAAATAKDSPQQPVELILVGHREGQRSLSIHKNCQGKRNRFTPYCGVAVFHYHAESKEFFSLGILETQKTEKPDKNCLQQAGALDDQNKKNCPIAKNLWPSFP